MNKRNYMISSFIILLVVIAGIFLYTATKGTGALYIITDKAMIVEKNMRTVGDESEMLVTVSIEDPQVAKSVNGRKQITFYVDNENVFHLIQIDHFYRVKVQLHKNKTATLKSIWPEDSGW